MAEIRSLEQLVADLPACVDEALLDVVVVVRIAHVPHSVPVEIELSRVADINISTLPDQYEDVTLSADAGDIISDPDIDIVVDGDDDRRRRRQS